MTFRWGLSQINGVGFLKEKQTSDLCDLHELILEPKGQVGYPTRDMSDCVAHTHLDQIHTHQMAAEELFGVTNCSNSDEVRELGLHTHCSSPSACLFFKRLLFKIGFLLKVVCLAVK